MSEGKPLVGKTQSPRTVWSSIRAYVSLTRIDKFPAGSNLVFWPCAWGILLSSRLLRLPQEQTWTLLAMYLLGSTLRHNAACVWNDICDLKFDRQVERSKTRPLACGAVSVTGAIIVLLAHLVVCYPILLLAGPEGTKVGLVGLLFLDPIYPLTKRWTHWPQAWLGLAMTWGLPTVWISMQGCTNLKPMFALFFGGVCWTIYYDTIYACQDRRDDVTAGVKSTAVLFGRHVRPILAIFAALFVTCLVYTGIATAASPGYYAITVAGSAVCLGWQLLTLDFDQPEACWKAFKANGNVVGMLIWLGMVADYSLSLAA